MERRSLLGLELAAARAGAFDLTTCGGAVQAGETAALRADLVCPPPAAARRAHCRQHVNLNGHTISGTGTTSGTGVQCGGSRADGFCVVHGPGLITNFGVAVVGGGASLRLEGLPARGNGSGLAHKAPRLIELVQVAPVVGMVRVTAIGNGRDSGCSSPSRATTPPPSSTRRSRGTTGSARVSTCSPRDR